MAVKTIARPGGRAGGHSGNTNEEVERRRQWQTEVTEPKDPVTEPETHRGVGQQAR